MKIHTQPDQLGGLWSNAAAVRHSPHEFTIDFLRCDFDEKGSATQAVLVQRINMSPLFVTQLIAALQENWSKYADKALPRDLMAGFDTTINPGMELDTSAAESAGPGNTPNSGDDSHDPDGPNDGAAPSDD